MNRDDASILVILIVFLFSLGAVTVWFIIDDPTYQVDPNNCISGPKYATIKPWNINDIADKYHIYNITNVSSIEAWVIVHFEQTCNEDES